VQRRVVVQVNRHMQRRRQLLSFAVVISAEIVPQITHFLHNGGRGIFEDFHHLYIDTKLADLNPTEEELTYIINFLEKFSLRRGMKIEFANTPAGMEGTLHLNYNLPSDQDYHMLAQTFQSMLAVARINYNEQRKQEVRKLYPACEKALQKCDSFTVPEYKEPGLQHDIARKLISKLRAAGNEVSFSFKSCTIHRKNN
jgi:hypothetical protein